MESPKGLKSLPANVRLEWMLLTVTNTLAYYDTELITLQITLHCYARNQSLK